MLITLGILTSALAVVAMWLSWRSQHRAGWLGALVLIGISGYVFSQHMGAAQGIFIALFLPGLLIWVPIFKTRTFKPFIHKAAPVRTLTVSWKKAVGHVCTGITLLVLQLGFSLLVAVGISRLFPIAEAGQLALCITLQPLIWAMMIFHFMGRKQRPAVLGWHFALAAIAGVTLVV